MYSDTNFFQIITCVFIIVLTSIYLLRSCELSSNYYGICNLLMVLFYPILMYVIIKSIVETKNSERKNKLTRYLINVITLLILVLIFFNNVSMIVKNGFQKKFKLNFGCGIKNKL